MGVLNQGVLIIWIIGVVLFILWWVFLYFFISGAIRRGINESVLGDMAAEFEDYHRSMLAIESQKLDLMRSSYGYRQQSSPAPVPASAPAPARYEAGEETMYQ